MLRPGTAKVGNSVSRDQCFNDHQPTGVVPGPFTVIKGFQSLLHLLTLRFEHWEVSAYSPDGGWERTNNIEQNEVNIDLYMHIEYITISSRQLQGPLPTRSHC